MYIKNVKYQGVYILYLSKIECTFDDRKNVIGHIQFVVDEHEKTSYLSFIHVKKKYRGKGLGEKMLNECVLFCKSEGCTKIKLDSMTSNTPEKNMFYRYGFSYVHGYKKGPEMELYL